MVSIGIEGIHYSKCFKNAVKKQGIRFNHEELSLKLTVTCTSVRKQ